MLDDKQKEAVRTTDGAQLIVAGPGTGKTRALVHRVAHLLTEGGVPAGSVLAVTFTRSAASEMRERLGALLGSSAPEELWVETFHAAALRILREEQYPGPLFTVLREEEKESLLSGLVPKRELPALVESVRRLKGGLRLPEGGPEAEYQRRLLDAKKLDFDDLFIYVNRLFDEKPEVLKKWRGRFRYVLVDEFQDTSLAQYEFMRRLASGHLSVIGDPDQAIYGFAGGGFSPFERFREDYPGRAVLSLTENYRSKSSILEAAKQVIAPNRAPVPRELRARLAGGLPVEVSAHQSELQEAEMIVRRIEHLLGGSSHFTIDSEWAQKEFESYSYGLSDIAVLYRFHAMARKLERALERSGLPYRTFGKEKPSEELEDHRESRPERGEAVSLMTLHRAKGLEFPVVFIAGCEEEVLPWGGSEVEEERRLFYVGMTRAKDRLFLSHVGKRFLFGGTLQAGPSRFVRDIEDELKRLGGSRPSKKKRPRKSQPSLFEL